MTSILEAKSLDDIAAFCASGACGRCCFSRNRKAKYKEFCAETTIKTKSRNDFDSIIFQKILSVNRKAKLEKLLNER